jgi:membrane-bound lytic murein transglycosylase A
MGWRRLVLVLLVIGVAAAAVWLWYTRTPSPPQRLTLTPVAFSDLPGWESSDPRAALSAFRRSCEALVARPPQSAMAYAGTAADWHAACAAAAGVVPRAVRAFFERNFAPYVLGDGLVTGYYEPLLHGSRDRHGRYQTPVYGVPDDLISVDLGRFRPEWKGERIAGRLIGFRLEPYPSRAEIDARPPPARVLFYGDDPVSVFFLHIQGSGRVRLDDGSVLRVAYGAQNGQRYTPIGHTLVDRGVPREGMSMQVIRAWLKAHPEQAREVMETDASFVFFRDAPVGDPALGPEGTEGVPLTPRASIAVDPRIHPFGVPFFLAGDGFADLFVAQDTGGAIRGPARADIFYGFGPAAENTAGGMKAHPRFYVLLPKGVTPTLAP